MTEETDIRVDVQPELTAEPGTEQADSLAEPAEAAALDVAEREAAAPEAAGPARPEGVPEKFWDPEAGAVRTEALVKSYRELERKLSRMVPLPGDETDEAGQERLRRALGVPESADGYQIQSENELIQPDPAINARLLEAGFNQRQAQMVYDLAAEYVVPLVDEAVAEVASQRDVERLAGHFGSEEAWRTVAEQIKTWGKANLPGETMDVLSSNFEGILAMHHMMRASEPRVVHGSEGNGSVTSESGLRELMRDPRYWRDRDPAIVARVTEGFARLYPR